MKLQVEKAEAVEFINCWQKTIADRSFVEPYNFDRGALVFSFDGQLKAFLNYTKGYHRSHTKRPYFEKLPRIMNRIRELVRPYRSLGGRVFIDDKQVYYVDRSKTEHHLCQISWPKGINVVTEVKNCRPKPKATMTLRVVAPRKPLAVKK